jgi:hypothetical protein
LGINLHSGACASATSQNVQSKASSAIILILPLAEKSQNPAIPRFSVILLLVIIEVRRVVASDLDEPHPRAPGVDGFQAVRQRRYSS